MRAAGGLVAAWRRGSRLPLTAGHGSGQRLLGVDVARAVALLGMVATHVLAATDSSGAPTLNHELFGGRASALFAVLAGVSIALLTGRERPVTGRARRRASLALVLRAVLIGALGLVLSDLGSGIAVILTYYGVLFVCALPVLGLRPTQLFVLGGACAVGLPLLSYAIRDGLDLQPTFGLTTFDRLVGDPGAVAQELVLTGYYPVVPWLAYLFVGLGVGRLDLRAPLVAARLVVVGAGLAVAARVLSEVLLRGFGGYDALAPRVEGDVVHAVARGAFGVVPTDTAWWLAVATPHTGTPLDLVHTIGSALAVLGVALLAVRVARLALLPLAAAGGMTLTLYSAHVCLVAVTDDRGTGFYGRQVLAGLVLALAWRVWVGRGPLEAGVAALTRVVRGRDARVAPPPATGGRTVGS